MTFEYLWTISNKIITHYCVVPEEDMTPLILDKEEKRDHADDHRAGDADDNHQTAVHGESLKRHNMTVQQ